MNILNKCYSNILLTAALVMAALTVQAGTTFTYYGLDATDSPVVAMNQAGAVIWRKTYAPYGKASNKDQDNRAGYTGHVEDQNGLVYAGARYYDSELGQFLSDDPSRFNENNPPSFGRYIYANNNPYKFVDPDGKDVILLNNSQAVMGLGHIAILVGSDKEGWHYFSKNGRDNGVESNTYKQFKTLKDYSEDVDVSSKFDRSRREYSDKVHDDAMIAYGRDNYNSAYDFLTNNCSDLVNDILKASKSAGPGNVTGNYDPESDGETLGISRPNKTFEVYKDDHLTPSEIAGPYSGTAHQ